jgi:hypothetical protein
MRPSRPQLVNQRSGPVPNTTCRGAEPESMKNGLFRPRDTKTVVTIELRIKPMSPRIYRHPLVPHEPDQGGFLPSSSLVPYLLPLELEVRR